MVDKEKILRHFVPQNDKIGKKEKILRRCAPQNDKGREQI